jgi:hypothetical protein
MRFYSTTEHNHRSMPQCLKSQIHIDLSSTNPSNDDRTNLFSLQLSYFIRYLLQDMKYSLKGFKNYPHPIYRFRNQFCLYLCLSQAVRVRVLLPLTFDKLRPAIQAAEFMLPKRVRRPLDTRLSASGIATETFVVDRNRACVVWLGVRHCLLV